MKKLAIFDPNGRKFTADMEEWWQSHGYEVKFDRYYDPVLVNWADIIWFDTCDNNLKSATMPDSSLVEEWKQAQLEGRAPIDVPWDMHDMDLSNKRIVVRPIDIEVWYGHQHNVDWGLVDNAIFIAPHIRDIVVNSGVLDGKGTTVSVIPCAVNLDRWTYKERQPGYNIAWVCERWASKGVDYAIQLMARLPKEYKLHALGIWHDYAWETAYHKDLIKHLGLEDRIIFYEDHVPSLDEWLEDKNFLLSCGKKEAFGYSIAEAMAKGIKPIPHRFLGADDIWPRLTWTTLIEAESQITNWDDYDSKKYLGYLYEHGYTLEQMMQTIEETING